MYYARPNLEKEKCLSREEKLLEQLEEEEEFMILAEKISGLIKEIGTTPTPRQLKERLDIGSKQMKNACINVKSVGPNDYYNLFVREARKILRKKDGLVVGFGRTRLAKKDSDDTPK